MRRVIPILTILLLIVHKGQSQDVRQALLSMQNAYSGADRLHIIMRVQGKENVLSNTFLYREKVTIKKDGQRFFYKYGPMDVLTNEKCIVTVDHQKKEMTYTSRKISTTPEVTAFSATIDSLLSYYETPQYLGKQGNVARYQLIQKAGQVKEIELGINIKTNLLTMIGYRYRNGQYVTIEFEIFDLQPAFEPTTFDVNQYIVEVNAKAVASDSFKGYQVNSVAY